MSDHVQLQALVKNEVFIQAREKYAVILGISPSVNARSPKLWNKAFSDLGMDSKMYPLDVDPENLPKLLEMLEQDNDFIGGAVAMPYKENLYRYLGERIDKSTRGIGAVNSLYRCEKGLLWGSNTDGKAAVDALKTKNIVANDKKILVLGFGGAGKAVSKFLSENESAESTDPSVVIATRGTISHDLSKYNIKKNILWNEIDSIIHEVDIVINCTSVGFSQQEKNSPLSPEQIDKLKTTCVVYDIIYNPAETLLLKEAKQRGLITLNGSEMNIGQAVLAFIRALGIEDNKKHRMSIRRSMITALEHE